MEKSKLPEGEDCGDDSPIEKHKIPDPGKRPLFYSPIEKYKEGAPGNRRLVDAIGKVISENDSPSVTPDPNTLPNRPPTRKTESADFPEPGRMPPPDELT